MVLIQFRAKSLEHRHEEREACLGPLLLSNPIVMSLDSGHWIQLSANDARWGKNGRWLGFRSMLA